MRRSKLQKLGERLDSLRLTRKRLYRQFVRRRISARDLECVYESLFLQAVVAFEDFCDGLFNAIVTGKLRYSRRIFACRVGVLKPDVARVVVLQRENYLDWLPWVRTLDRCRLYF